MFVPMRYESRSYVLGCWSWRGIEYPSSEGDAPFPPLLPSLLEAEFEGGPRHSVKRRGRVVRGALHEVFRDVPFEVVPSHVQVSARQSTSVAVRNRGLTLLHVGPSDFKLAEGANLNLLVQAYYDDRRYMVWCTRYTLN